MVKHLTDLVTASGSFVRIVVLIVVIVLLHVMVTLIRRLSGKLMSSGIGLNLSRSRTIASLATSIAIFVLYFMAFGLILKELGVSLKTYLASASIIGLAIGFGSQGLVQDVVNGLTIVFSGLFNVGDMVEIGGQTGIVRSFGMRFTVIDNALGAQVSIPNRTITNLVRYPRGYVRALVDITLPGNPEFIKTAEEKVSSIVASTFQRLPGIFLTAPSIRRTVETASAKKFLRVNFHLWPGREGAIETVFKPEVVYAMKALDANYQDWMVTVNIEVERKSRPL